MLIVGSLLGIGALVLLFKRIGLIDAPRSLARVGE